MKNNFMKDVYKEFLNSKSTVISFLILFLLIITLPITIILISQKQQTRQNAQVITPTPTPVVVTDPQYLIVNKINANENKPDNIDEVRNVLFGAGASINHPDAQYPSRRLGLSYEIDYLNLTDGEVDNLIRDITAAAVNKDMPMLIRLDGVNWWGNQSALWNWFDPSQPGFNPENIYNVEWTSWASSSAITKSWRNWGNEMEISPHPNLGSPAYIQIKKDKLTRIIPQIANWYKNLPNDKKYLLAGIALDKELSIGVNFYTPQGPINLNSGPNFGKNQLGYAAVKSYGIKTSGTLTIQDLNEAVKRHADMLSKTARDAGLSVGVDLKDKLYIHGGGNSTEGNYSYSFSYDNMLNNDSRPGWSFYRVSNPDAIEGLPAILSNHNGPWGALEWNIDPEKNKSQADWENALRTTFSYKNNKIIDLYNWESIYSWQGTYNNALVALKNIIMESGFASGRDNCFVCDNCHYRGPYTGVCSAGDCNPNLAQDGCYSQNNLNGAVCDLNNSVCAQVSPIPPTNTPTPTLAYAPSCTALQTRIQAAFLSTCGETKYDKVADLTKDTYVNGADMSKLVGIGMYNENVCQIALNDLKNPCITPTPTPMSTFSNLSASMPNPGSATFKFSYSGISSYYYVNASTYADMSWDVYINFAQGASSSITLTNPTKWAKYSCGKTLYWQVRDVTGNVKSPIQKSVVTCAAPTPMVATKLTVSTTSTNPGAYVTVSWSNIVKPSYYDWIGIYSQGTVDSAYKDYIYVSSCTKGISYNLKSSGSCSFMIPKANPEGPYEFRLFSNGSYTKLAASPLVYATSSVCMSLFNRIVAANNTTCGNTKYDHIADIDKNKYVDTFDQYRFRTATTEATKTSVCQAYLNNNTNPCP